MDYRILGPVEALADGDRVDLGGPLERALLARLLLSRGRPVSQLRLVEDLWEGDPPESAQVSLRVRVSKLRKALAGAGAGGAVHTGPEGYRLSIGEGDCLDAAVFRELADRGRMALRAGSAAEAARLLRDALDLWRGPPIAGVGEVPFARAEAGRLEEERLVVIADAFDARLALGEDAELVAELENLCGRHPLHERLWGQRMLALYRSGRQADSLAAFRQLRELLREDLGIDPSQELVELERRILKQSPDLISRTKAEVLPSGVVTFMLTDIEGSTRLWESAHRAMGTALQRHDELVATAVRAHTGSLIKSKGEGDATLSVFRRTSDALLAAVELHHALAIEQWPGGIELRVRIALHTGEAQERDGDYFGPTLNRAARLRALASGGQIVLSRVTADLARDELPEGLEMVDLGEHGLRGSVRAERVYELKLAVDDQHSSHQPPGSTRPPLPDAIQLSAAGPCVGRDGPLHRLEALLVNVRRGSAQAAFISGEPGIGKTRLASELACRAYEQGAVVLYGRCDEDSAFPYQPFIEALRQYVASNPSQIRQDLPSTADLAHLLPELGLSRPLGPAPEDAEGARYKLFDAVARVLEHAAGIAPLVLVLDDLHWAERPTLLLLRQVLRSCHAVPLFLIATYRESDLGRTRPFAATLADLRRERAFERIALRGLTEDDVVHLLEETAHHSVGHRGRALARALTETTDGNPFFMAQIVGHLIETESIKRIDGRWVLQERVEDLSIPEGVQEAVGLRLSRLSDSCNRALAAASVLGRTFELDVLARMTDADVDEVLTAVEEAIKAGLVNELADRLRPACAFTHALVQQALYSELSLARKQRLHLRAADAIESVHRSDLDGHVPALAAHLRAAGVAADPAQTIDYSIRATEITWRLLAYEDAMVHAQASLDLMNDHETQPAKRARILETLGDVCFVAASDHARGLVCLEEALQILEDGGMHERAARVHLKLGRSLSTFWAVMDIPRAKRHLRQAQAIIGSSDDPEVAGRLAIALGTVAVYDTDLDLVAECAAKAMELGRETPAIWAAGASLQGWWLGCSARVDECIEIIDRAWHAADRIDRLTTAFSATWIAAGWASMMDCDEALRYLQRELDKPRESQASNTREVLHAVKFGSLVMAGRLQEARALKEEMAFDVAALPLGIYGDEVFAVASDSAEELLVARIERFRHAGNQPGAQGTTHALAHLLTRTGRVDEARVMYKRALAGFGRLGLPMELYTRASLALLDVEHGDLAAASSHVSRGDEIAALGSGLGFQLASHLVARGALAAARGRLADANLDFAEAVEIDRRAHHPWHQAEALHAWGRALLAAGEAEPATQRFDEALLVYAAIGADRQWTDPVLRDKQRSTAPA